MAHCVYEEDAIRSDEVLAAAYKERDGRKVEEDWQLILALIRALSQNERRTGKTQEDNHSMGYIAMQDPWLTVVAVALGASGGALVPRLLFRTMVLFGSMET